MKRTLPVFCFLLFLLLFQSAQAEQDNFGFGTGRNGAITIAFNTTINSYAGVVAPVSPGDNTISIGTIRGAAGGFAAGDLVLVWQSTGLTPVPASGTAGPFNLNGSSTGRWELARVAAFSSSTLTLTAPLIRSYTSSGCQVVRVPEYTSVTINSTRQLTAYAWDGTCGGIIAFLATGTVTNNGQVNANAIGFRGGQPFNDMSGAMGATGLDEAAPLGAQKGEGLVLSRYGSTHTGRGNVANGAGGGVALSAGGGGGGNGAAGGRGGNSDGYFDGNRPVGGLGGGAISFDALTQLSLGGGGGAGHASNMSGVAAGRGGGVVFIRCNQLTGTGTINANGGTPATGSTDAGSGGGAGGTVYIRAAGSATFGSVTAAGGAGSNCNEMLMGPGGGGGGGVILLQRSAGSGTPVTPGGANGNQPDPGATGGMAYGAMAGTSGVVTTLSTGMVVPAAPIVMTPANGSLVNGRPTITGTAAANTSVELYLDDQLLATIPVGGSGNFSYPLAFTLADGSHTLKVYTMQQALYSPSSFTSFTSSATLPVNLLTFTAVQQVQDITLHWTTAAEYRLAVYLVERSTDGRNFATLYGVKPMNTSGEHRYSFTDREAGSGKVFYRLKIVEDDNGFRYSRVVVVNRSKALALFPNPASETLQVQVPAGKQLVQIADATGRTVYQAQVTGSAAPTTIDIRPLHPGVYYLTIGAVTTRFIKTAQ